MSAHDWICENLDGQGVEHEDLDPRDALHLCLAIGGGCASGPTRRRARRRSSFGCGSPRRRNDGRYRTPAQDDLQDGGDPVEAVVLMAVVQRRFLPAEEPAWEDGAIAARLGVPATDVTRAQRALEAAWRLLTASPSLLPSAPPRPGSPPRASR
jgi:hypothetical protein